MKKLLLIFIFTSLFITSCNYNDIKNFGKQDYIKNCEKLKLKYYGVEPISSINHDIVYTCIDDNKELHYLIYTGD